MNGDTSKQINKDTAVSIQLQVEMWITGKIQSGEWETGSKIPSERELCQTLDVSRTTVRNAILKLTNRGVFERVIGQGTFVRSSPSMGNDINQVKAKTGNIGFIVCKEREVRKPLSHEAFYFDIFSGIEETLASSDRHLLYTYLNDFDQQEITQLDQFLDKVDGVIIEELRNNSLIQHLKERSMPTVLLAPTIESSDTDLVTMDIYQGVRKAVQYLGSLGHRDIAIIDGPLHLETARNRHKAWEDSLKELTGKVSPDLAAGGKSWTTDGGYAAMEELLGRSRRPSAVFCANDLIAIGAVKAIQNAGLVIPDDISIMGFDDIEVASLTSPALTTMKIFSRKMGRAAVKRIIEQIEEEQTPPVTITFPIEIVVRNSCREVK